MSKWKTVKLGEVATYINGFAFKPSDWCETGLPIIRIQNLTNSSKEINYYDKSYNPKYEVNKGDILISWSASLGVYEWKKGKALLNQHIFKVVFDKLDIDKKFFVYSIQTLLTQMAEETHGATMKHITKPKFDNMPFPLPSLEEQKRIADILDKASNLIDLRKQQLEKMDLLIKSKFIDMFGNPVTNPKGWEGKKIEDIAEVKIGPFGSLLHLEDYVENGHPLINPSHILNESITYDSKKTITDEKYKEMKPYHLQINDIVLGRRGEIGRCAIVKQNGFMCGTGSLLIRIKNNCLPIIMQKIISHPSFKEFLKDKSVGVTMDNLNAGTISNLKIFLPPIELQNQFAEFVEQVEKQKAVMQQSLEKMEMNYKALMQEYF